jgi:FkbM family methyltransferase
MVERSMSKNYHEVGGFNVPNIAVNARSMAYLAYMRLKKSLGGRGLTRIRIVNHTYHWLETKISPTWKPNTIRLQGNIVKLNPNDRAISDRMLHSGIWEKLETDVIKTEVKKGNTFVDIGANIGYYTLIAAQKVGKLGKVFAFEPEPYNFSLLQDNVAINRYENVELIRAAVANVSGKLRLFLSQENPGDHRSYDSSDGREFIDVEAVSLDDYFAGFEGRIDFIKMDVEGAELGVLKGMPLLLRKHPQLKLITEFWPFGLTKSGVEPQDYLNSLIQIGFVLQNIDDDKQSIKPITVAELLTRYTAENKRYTNLLCARSDPLK